MGGSPKALRQHLVGETTLLRTTGVQPQLPGPHPDQGTSNQGSVHTGVTVAAAPSGFSDCLGVNEVELVLQEFHNQFLKRVSVREKELRNVSETCDHGKVRANACHLGHAL